MKKYLVKTEEETAEIAKNVAKNVKKGDIFTLTGDLGSGKTFFTSCFIKYLYKLENRDINITSPTFNIVKSYETKNFLVYHFDLYRIKKEQELYELDLDTAFENISLIEWPEIIYSLLPRNPIEIKFKIKEENYREIEIG